MPRTSLLSLALLALLALPFAAFAQNRSPGKNDPTVFDSKPATFSPDIFADKQKTDGTLRVLTIDERMGYPRKNALVRVPLYLHAAEAPTDPNAFIITPLGGGQPLTYQADDIRKDPSGKIARMTLYFFVDSLPAWGRLQFELKKGTNPAAKNMPASEADGKVTLTGNDIALTFHTSGNLTGAIAAVSTPAGKISIPDSAWAPAARIIRQATPGAVPSRSNEFSYADPASFHVKSMKWAAGPVFSKVALQITPASAPEDIVEYIYLIPNHGSEFTQTQLLYPDGPDTLETVGTDSNTLLAGKLVLGDSPADQKVIEIPAGIRKNLRSFFGYKTRALVNDRANLSIAMIPTIAQGAANITSDETGSTTWRGPSGFKTAGNSGSQSLRVWWGQVRFIFSKNTQLEDLWNQQTEKFQPLTAVVDEPWAEPAMVLELGRKVVQDYYKVQWGRGYDANLVMAWLSGGNVEGFLKPGAQPNQDVRTLIPTVEAKEAAWKKWQGVGALDPYNIAHVSSAQAVFSKFIQKNEGLDRYQANLGLGSWLANGILTPEGWPNIRNFANTANMKVGAYLTATYGGKQTNDPNLFRWGLDAASVQNLLANYGHGERPYDMSPGNDSQSPFVYVAITDVWLRATELVANEDLMLHPAIFGRYADALDVNADIYQKNPTYNEAKVLTGFTPNPYRATFLRLQSYDFRWMGFAGEAYLGMLAKASDKGRVGVTEAVYAMHKDIGTGKSWNGLITSLFYPAVLCAEGWKDYQPVARPPLPANTKVLTTDSGNTLSWDPVPNAAGYRIHRAERLGGPFTWLNSPYTKIPPYKLLTDAEMTALREKAEAANIAKAAELKVDIKKLPAKDRVAAWQLLPEIKTPTIPDTLIKETRFTDPDGKKNHIYFITAEDKEGRQSRWFPNEPAPAPTK